MRFHGGDCAPFCTLTIHIRVAPCLWPCGIASVNLAALSCLTTGHCFELGVLKSSVFSAISTLGGHVNVR